MTSTAAVRTLRLLLAAMLLHMAASSGCKCSEFGSSDDDAATVRACESAGDGKGCKWEEGMVYGGYCKGDCTTTNSGGSSSSTSGTGGSDADDGGGTCECRDYSSDDEDTCEKAGDGTGCEWDAGMVYGGICRGICTTGQEASNATGPTSEECNMYGECDVACDLGVYKHKYIFGAASVPPTAPACLVCAYIFVNVATCA